MESLLVQGFLLARPYSPDALMLGFVGWVGATDVRFYVMDAADCLVWRDLFKEGAEGKPLFGLRVNPDPAEMVDVGENIITPQIFPSFNIAVGCLEVPAVLSAAVTTSEAGSRFLVE